MATITEKFLNQLSTAHNENKTGVVFAYIKGDDSTMETGILYFLKGVLCGSVLENFSGSDAIEKILNAKILSTVFLQKNKKELVEQPSMPSMDSILSKLVGKTNDVVVAQTLSSNEVVQAVVKILSDIIGPNAASKVEKIASTYPPDTDMSNFSSECIKFASNFIGNKLASDVLLPIFEG